MLTSFLTIDKESYVAATLRLDRVDETMSEHFHRLSWVREHFRNFVNLGKIGQNYQVWLDERKLFGTVKFVNIVRSCIVGCKIQLVDRHLKILAH